MRVAAHLHDVPECGGCEETSSRFCRRNRAIGRTRRRIVTTTPPRPGLWLLRRFVDADLREWVVADIEHRYRALRTQRGLWAAQRWFWKQVAHGIVAGREQRSTRPFSRRHVPFDHNGAGDARRPAADAHRHGGTPLPAPHLLQRNRHMSVSNFFGNLARDLRFSLRELIFRHPAPTAVAVVTLALGIGANTAIFSVLHAVMLRPLPFEDAGSLAMIWRDTARGQTTWISIPEFLDYRDELAPAMQVAAFGDGTANLTGDGEPQRVSTAAVSGNYFDVIGVQAQLGRTFEEAEAAPGGVPVVLLGDGLWRRRYGADPSVVGRDILVDGAPRTVIGVLPAGLRLPIDYREEARTELYVPLAFDRSNAPQRGDRSWHAVVRLGAGTSFDEARTGLDALHRHWQQEGLFGSGDFNPPGLVGIRAFLFGEVRPMLLLLAGAAGFVLAIACANVASMMLARGEARRREIGVRVALGAGRGRVARQMLTESLVLALMGGGLALLVSALGLALVRRWGPAYVPRIAEVGAGGAMLAIALGVTLLTGLLFGILPAVHAAGAQPRDLLSDGARGDGRGRGRLRRALVVGELALAVMLAVAALLMVRSFVHVRSVDLGFDPDNVLTLRLELPATTYADGAARLTFWRRVIDGIEALPGIELAGAARRLPLASNMGDWSITIEGRDKLPGENPNGDFQVVMPGYFEAMGMQLVRGRLLTDADRADTLPVVVISEAMAATYWPGEEAIGRRFRIGDETTPWYEIVGIVRGMKHNAVLEGPRTEMYHAVSQFALAAGVPRGMSLVIRTQADPLALVDAVRGEIAALDATLPVTEVRSMNEVVTNASADTRFTMALLAGFGGVALLLAATGIYGVVSYSVRRQTRAIGIRMAIGADRSRVLGEVLRDSGGSLALGMALGIAGALAVGGSMGGLLVGVEPADPLTYAAVVGTVVVVTLAATLVPALRAAAIDPVIALRDQ